MNSTVYSASSGTSHPQLLYDIEVHNIFVTFNYFLLVWYPLAPNSGKELLIPSRNIKLKDVLFYSKSFIHKSQQQIC